MSTVREDLIAARALIATPEQWTKGAFAKDAEGRVVDVDDEKAVCFCALGAIWRASHAPSRDARELGYTSVVQEFVHRAAKEVTGDSSILLVNDFGTHKEVLKVFDRAIELAGE